MKLRFIISKTISEMDASIDQPMVDTTQASNMAQPDQDGIEDDDKLELKKDIERQVKQQHKQTLSPVLDKLDQNFNDLDQGLDLGREQMQQSVKTMDGMDKQLTGSQSLLANIEKLL